MSKQNAQQPVDAEYIRELEFRIEELKAEKDKEYFARLSAEHETRIHREAFKALVREVVNLSK